MTNSLTFTKFSVRTNINGFTNPFDPTISLQASKSGIGINYYDRKVGREVGVLMSPEEAEMFIEEIHRLLKVSAEKYQ